MHLTTRTAVLLMGFTGLILAVFIAFYWLICIIWAIIAVVSYNQKIENEAIRQMEVYYMMNKKR